MEEGERVLVVRSGRCTQPVQPTAGAAVWLTTRRPPVTQPRPLLAGALALGALTACRAPLSAPAWSVAERGTLGVFGRLGVYSDYEAQSEFGFESNFGAIDVDLTTELVGEFGGAVGVEWFVARDLSLLAGADHRVFQPEESAGFVLDEVSSDELFLAVRWLLPPAWGADGRLRAFVEGKLGYVPSTAFEAEIDFQSQGATIPNPAFDFDGSAWWNAGLSTGLVYQLGDHVVAQLSVIYEWPLTGSEDTVVVAIPSTPLVLDLESALEPEGLIALVGITVYF